MTISVSQLTSGQWSSTAGPVTTASVSPTGSGLIILVVNTEQNSATVNSIASIAGTLSATWTLRSRNQYSAGSGQTTEVWSAPIAAATSGTIQFTMAATVDDATYFVLFATGTITQPKWDVNPSLPLYRTSATGGTGPASTTSTAPYVLIFAGNAQNANNSGPTPVSTALSTVNNGGATLYQYSNAWGGTPGQLTNVTSGCSTPGAKSTITVDALSEVSIWQPTGAQSLVVTPAGIPTTQDWRPPGSQSVVATVVGRAQSGKEPSFQNVVATVTGPPFISRAHMPSGVVNIVATVTGTSTPVQLLAGTGFFVSVYDVIGPNTNLIAIIPNPESVQFEDTLSDVGSGQVTVATADVPATVFQKDNIWRITWEGVERFAFIAEQIQDDSVQDSQVHRYTVAGKGIAQWLDKTKVYPPGGVTGTGSTRSFKNVTMASIYQTLLNEGKARGANTQIAQYNWNAVHDSNASGWTDSNQLQVAIGTSMLDLLNTFAQAVPFDWHMDSRFNLSLFKTMGTDKSASVMIQPAGSTLSATLTTDRTTLWDVVLVQDANNAYSEQSDTPTITALGRREQFASSQNVVDSTGRADYGYSLLQQWKVPAVQRESNPSTTIVGRRPFIDYQLGDYINAEWIDGSVTKSRVIAIALAGGPGQTVEEANVTLDFNFGQPVNAGTSQSTSLSYTGPQTIYADNGGTPWTIGTAVAIPITLQLVASVISAVTCNVYLKGNASAALVLEADIYLDNNLVRSMTQVMAAGENTWTPVFMISALPAGSHQAQLRLSVSAGTLTINAFDLQNFYTGNGLQGGTLGGSTLISIVDTINSWSHVVTDQKSLAVQTPLLPHPAATTTPAYHTVTDVDPPSPIQLGYVMAVIGSANDGVNAAAFTTAGSQLESGNDGGTVQKAFMRFVIPATLIPAAATLTYAILTITGDATASGAILTISAEHAAGPTAPTSATDYNGRVKTTATVPWTGAATASGTALQSPDLTSIINELFTAFGPNAITAINIFVEDNGSPTNGLLRYRAVDNAANTPAVLTLRWH